MLRLVRRAQQARAAEHSEDGMALLLSLMLIMIVAAMAVLMLGVVVAQVKPTMFGTKNQQTVFAAEAGIDATMSQLRLALGAEDLVTHKTYGDSRKLPCSVQGHLGGTNATLQYTVTITYFDTDPKGKDQAWRDANKLACSPTNGVSIAPSFAVISAEGMDAKVAGMSATAGDRTVETVYTFQVSNNNINGGVIYAFGDTFCLQADGQTAGSTITYVPAAGCREDDPRRLWSWGTDYALRLSVTDLGTGTPMCITGRPATAGANVIATLQPCTGATNQEFSWEGGARWRGENAAGTDYSTFCLGAGSAVADLTGVKVQIGWCGPGDTAQGSFDPDARVGAGAAGYATNQIVNFLEFGRCMDVTNENVTMPYMIVYPCKQDPSGGSKLKWNHKWYYTEPGGTVGSLAGQWISVNNGGSSGTAGAKYCLTSPALATSPANVTMQVCSGSAASPAANQRWVRNALMSTYADSWTFTDQYGRCISLGDKMPSTSWSTMVMATCTGGPEQKWNAPAKGQAASLDDFRETH
jgi:hypothetical protein